MFTSKTNPSPTDTPSPRTTTASPAKQSCERTSPSPPNKFLNSPLNPQLTLPSSGILAGGFGGVAGFFALFFFAEVPRVREDIMKKVPVLGSYFNVEIPPEDNPF
jgi:hypothetical protein